ncbi:hypothetical protein A8B82_12915 [Sulfitobacter sp. EhC04]|uniref:hypothetical protein n=1 Tax=Sulfitobacter sp. EhC04 TaxID=1849168 RepID=UPI0007F4723D|nr:hypothetical protein [Sulfitobacter sp. EhC04]OAN77497.1 hypothetical protein A8B82_12915 [Sulfitobacter sp. EhC04]
MEKPSKVDQIHSLCEALFGERHRNYLSVASSFLDISRPNFHDSKTEFLQELTAVEAIISHCDGIFSLLVGQGQDAPETHKLMIDRLVPAINQHVMQSIAFKEISTPNDLAVKNVVETGFHYSSLLVVLHMMEAYRRRLKELKQQEVDFWNVTHRPPKYYARTVALRFARLFAQERRVKPTIGTVSDGSHPSTDYGRALEEVFNILEINANVRTAGEWAIRQLEESDWNPPLNALSGGLFGMGTTKNSTGPTISPVVEALSKA